MDQTPGDHSSQGAPRTSSHNPDTPARPSQQDGPAPLPLTRVSRPQHRSRRPPSQQQQQQQPSQQRAGEGARNPPYWLRSGGPPPPDVGSGPYPRPEPLPLPVQGRPWVHHVEQQFTSTIVQGNAMPMTSGIPPINQLPWLQHPGAPTPGPVPSFGEIGEMAARLAFGDTASDPHPMARPPMFLSPAPEQHPPGSIGFMPPHFVPFAPPVYAPAYYSYSAHPNQPPSQPPASSTSRAPRSVAPQPTSFPPAPPYQHETPTPHPSTSSDRRRPAHGRARRPVNARYATVDARREGNAEVALSRGALWQGGRTPNYSVMDDPMVREAMNEAVQLGNNVMIVSRAALAALERVNPEQLPEQERTCVICYNDYGEESAEGITEVPLRLPRCRHVFGDHCIRRWFEDSDSCPYCRDKLPSSPKSPRSILRAYLHTRGGGIPPGMSEEVYTNIMASLPIDGDHNERAPRGSQPAERRSLPDDTDSQRRIRPRRDSNEDLFHSDDEWRGPWPITTTFPAALTGAPTRERLERWLGTPPRIQATSAQVAASNLAGDVVLGPQGSTSQAAPPTPAHQAFFHTYPRPNMGRES